MAFSGQPEHANLKSAQARYAAHAAARSDFTFQSLDGADGYLFEVRDGERVATFAAGAGTPYAMNDTRAASIARDKAFCAEVLRRAGVSVLPGELFFVTPRWREMRSGGREADDAVAYVARGGFPIFCKPVSASNGLFAELVESADHFASYLDRVGRDHFAILIQPYVRAPEYRVFVLEGRALFSYRKALPSVVGDGVRTVSDLIAGGSTRAVRDEAGQRIASDVVVMAGVRVWLDGPANRAAGGGAEHVVDGARDDLARVALAAVDAVGLRLAAVDLFDRDDGPAVIEVNSNPMIATLEEHGRWDLIEAIWRANIAAALR